MYLHHPTTVKAFALALFLAFAGSTPVRGQYTPDPRQSVKEQRAQAIAAAALFMVTSYTAYSKDIHTPILAPCFGLLTVGLTIAADRSGAKKKELRPL